MKLSLAWIFDYINTRWQDQDVCKLVSKFNQTTAEIEKTHPVSYCLNNFYLAQQKTINSKTVVISELGQEVEVSQRSNTVDLITPNNTSIVFMVKKIDNRFEWASLADFGVEKQGLLPAFDANEQELNGGWRDLFECEDIILEVDNKSITHRPDMWGHRGFAREIAAFLNLEFLPKENFLIKHDFLFFNEKSEKTESTRFVIENKAPKICKKFNGLYFSSIQNKPSNIFIASRLLKIGSRPINGIVDLTNYVAFDWAQPVHAYDAEKIIDKKIIIRPALSGEKLDLLDGNQLKLTRQDLVIADGEKPMGLAGVKGGIDDSITETTTSIFFESANFDAAAIRRSAAHHKTRTDSSARFEKTLDPNQSREAILRFLMLAEKTGLKTKYADKIISVGTDVQEPIIRVTHDFLEKRLGHRLSQTDVVNILTSIEFNVTLDSEKDLTYCITIPTFRSSKDITIKEDILEEIVRLYGFEKIKLKLPDICRSPFDDVPLRRKRKIRQFLAYSAKMIEQQNYSFYDEKFLTELGLSFPTIVKIVNPVSENYFRLVCSLVPAILKNLNDNLVHKNSLNFFEIGKIWNKKVENVCEKYEISGIFFEKRKQYDFYRGKELIANLFQSINFDKNKIVWQKMVRPVNPWYGLHQSANLLYDNKIVGHVGIVEPTVLSKLNTLPESSAFVFELDGEFLLHAKSEEKKYLAFSRYQETFFDLSIMTPLEKTTQSLKELLQKLSPLILSVELIDFFEKEEWYDVRSLTFRVWLGSNKKTLDKEEIDRVRNSTVDKLSSIGIQIRS
jgi:phenylalanyl-tRNA synthetase beta chain